MHGKPFYGGRAWKPGPTKEHNMRADILIKNGRILDPANGVDKIGDVAVKNRKIVAVPDEGADVVIDASGCLVTPGVIDYHCHIFDRATDSGLNPDIAMLSQGVTTAVDAGCSGTATYRDFLDRLNTYYIKTKLFLHVCPDGQSNHQYSERLYPDTWNMDKFASALEIGGDKILGFKVRISRAFVGDEGARVFYKTLEVAERFNKPACVHVTDSIVPLDEVANALRPGDIFCHMYQGTGHTILGEDGNILPAVRKAQERGVIMDSCHGIANFSFATAEAAMAHGFLPDVITTDLTTRTWNKFPLYGMPHVLSKFLHLGMSEAEIIKRVTAVPAKLIGMADQLGALSEGTCADITIMKLKDGEIQYGDALGEKRTGNRYFAPMATILDGVIVYRSPELWD